jgi:hypothetical protein
LFHIRVCQTNPETLKRVPRQFIFFEDRGNGVGTERFAR